MKSFLLFALAVVLPAHPETLKSGSLYCKDSQTFADMQRAIVHENYTGIQYWAKNGCQFADQDLNVTVIEKGHDEATLKVILTDSQSEAVVAVSSLLNE